MSVISIVMTFKTNKPPSHKVLKRSDKSYSTTEVLLPLGGIRQSGYSQYNNDC